MCAGTTDPAYFSRWPRVDATTARDTVKDGGASVHDPVRISPAIPRGDMPEPESNERGR